MQLQRRARDVFHLGHGNEVAQVPQFHFAKWYAWQGWSGKEHSGDWFLSIFE
jgi:hypothetical protein